MSSGRVQCFVKWGGGLSGELAVHSPQVRAFQGGGALWRHLLLLHFRGDFFLLSHFSFLFPYLLVDKKEACAPFTAGSGLGNFMNFCYSC